MKLKSSGCKQTPQITKVLQSFLQKKKTLDNLVTHMWLWISYSTLTDMDKGNQWR